ncbi:MAG: hypothetical protein JW787_00650 [Sedimentisphaerales bacterium]|nr:hypothetical protein [Sedimentisphaerales bacterium]
MNTQQKEPESYINKIGYEIIYTPGSLISGFVPIDINSISVEESLGITVKVTALEQMPENSLDPIESHTKMILVSPSENPIMPITQLGRGSRIGYIPDADKFINNIAANNDENNIKFRQFQGILAHGVTTSFEFFESKTINSEQPEGFGFWIYLGTQAKKETEADILQGIAVVTNGKLKRKINIEQEGSQNENKINTELLGNEQWEKITETILLGDFSIEVNKPIGMIIPSPFNVGKAKAFAVTIEVNHPPDEVTSNVSMYADSFKGLIEQLWKSEVYRKSSQINKPDTAFLGIDESIQVLRFPTNRRGVLLYFSQKTESSLVEDISLSGSQNVLEILSDTIIQEYSSGLYKDIQALGWMLERCAYKVLVEMLSSDSTVPELESVLVRHTGEVGRHVASLEELVAASSGREDLHSRLIKENIIYLEDMSPASRTRAFEWLTSINKAPDGYNPLASLKERRDVLDSFESDSN